MRTDCPLVEQAACRPFAGLAGRIGAVVVLAGGLFGAIWNTVGDVQAQLPPATVQPSPAVEPGWTVESPDNDACEDPIYTV